MLQLQAGRAVAVVGDVHLNASNCWRTNGVHDPEATLARSRGASIPPPGAGGYEDAALVYLELSQVGFTGTHSLTEPS